MRLARARRGSCGGWRGLAALIETKNAVIGKCGDILNEGHR